MLSIRLLFNLSPQGDHFGLVLGCCDSRLNLVRVILELGLGRELELLQFDV